MQTDCNSDSDARRRIKRSRSSEDEANNDLSNGAPRMTITFSLNDKKGALAEVLKPFETLGVNMTHIESRPSHNNPGKEYDFFIDCDGSSKSIQTLVEQLKLIALNVTVHSSQPKDDQKLWIPRRMKDLDYSSTSLMNTEVELDSDHPGFNDPMYRKRRQYFADIASNYRHGDPLPRVEYTEEEIKTWGTIFRELTKLYPTHACKEYNHAFPLLVQNCGYREDNIPQLQDVSRFLQECTGFTLRPVSGFLSFREFFAGFAFRVHFSTQYIRHPAHAMYSPAPDVCHELLGHVPMFCDPDFAKFAQEVGLASLGAPDEYLEKLATLFWFTVEFGLCKQDGALKAYGGALLSSFRELQHCLSGVPEIRPFDPAVTAIQKYPITKMQPVYFLDESFQDARQKMIDWGRTIPRPFTVHYDPYTQTLKFLDNKQSIRALATDIKHDVGMLEEALSKIQ